MSETQTREQAALLFLRGITQTHEDSVIGIQTGPHLQQEILTLESPSLRRATIATTPVKRFELPSNDDYVDTANKKFIYTTPSGCPILFSTLIPYKDIKKYTKSAKIRNASVKNIDVRKYSINPYL